MQLVFSTPGAPRGRGRIERFFATLTQMFLCDLPGYMPTKGSMRGKPTITLPELDRLLGAFFCGGLPQTSTYRDKDITIGTLGGRRLCPKNARFA
jgi:hypothetical protein